ncbi:hypothetical protein B0J13DRAFT_479066 [Dactylonectria estremocensis]|uniref:Zn(2)-C6 fungal-type domain-containing protein n=1 Tax=Dactylonectria estremocensis TaxID=1079267 RepID=A0A9P9EIQ3_9HYPO|nr:hypothetical protein B0J13DRAFT_479066 [Dactylonectria estremocensis]
MVGVPSSRGCDGCRKQRKKCDQGQPRCKRCTRLDIPCVGSGLKRWKFQAFQPDSSFIQPLDAPRRIPSSETMFMTSALISILEIDDERHDIRFCGPHFIPELPRRIGSNPAFDASISAMVASYNSVALRKPQQNALALYGNALSALRASLQDPKQSVVLKMETVIVMFICQMWIDHKYAEKHREVMAHLLEEIISQGKLSKIDPRNIRPICMAVIYGSLTNPKIELGSWFWDAISKEVMSARPRPYRSGGQASLVTLELGTMADLSMFLRDPERYLYQLKCHYNILSLERPVIRRLVEQLEPVSKSSEATLATKKAFIAYAAAYGGLLSQTALVSPVLEAFDVHSAYVSDSHQFCDEAVKIAHQCRYFRPCGAAWVPELLKLTWASLKDAYRHREIEELIAEYEEDVDGGNYLEEARDIRNRFDRMGWSDEPRFMDGKKGSEKPPECVIL